MISIINLTPEQKEAFYWLVGPRKYYDSDEQIKDEIEEKRGILGCHEDEIFIPDNFKDNGEKV